jgi:hypothetical protein
VGALEGAHVIVVAPEHERGGREQLEVVDSERRPLVGARERFVGLEPPAPRVGVTSPLELAGRISCLATHDAPNPNVDGS